MLAGPPDQLRVKMVLPVRIELTTSALPRMRSTTELRQHCEEVAPLTVRARACQPGLPSSAVRVRTGAMADKKSERDKRLAAALRDNLKRRKAGARQAETKRKEPEKPA